MVSSRVLLLGAAAVLAAAVGITFAFNRPPAPAPQPVAPQPAPKVAPAPSPAAAVHVTPETAAPAAPAKPAKMVFPGGVEVAPLNGVTETVKLIWGDKPYTPIVKQVFENGWEWYVHEDGTHSTVVMLDCQGKKMPFGIVAQPTQALPTREEAERQLQQQIQQPTGR